MSKKSVFVIGAVVTGILAGAILLLAFGGEDAPEVRLRPDDLKLVAQGKKIYDAQCASCHGRDLVGESNWRERDEHGLLPAPPHDETGHTWHHPDTVLFELTKYGPAKLVGGDYQSNMPGFDGMLSDEEIIASLSYIKSRWPEDVQKRHDQMNQAARQ